MSMTNPNIKPQIINDRTTIQQLDKQNVLGSIEALADQVRQAWEETKNLDLKLSAKINNVVVAGMGGSGLGASVVKHLFKDQLTIPFEVVNSYSLPAYVNQNSLVILSSYSGNTEEILSCAEQAQAQQAQLVIITSGGQLAELAATNHYSIYLIKPDHNPSQQPRMAIGYNVIGLMGLLNQAKLIAMNSTEIENIVEAILTTSHKCRVELETDNNPAKALTFSLVDRRPNLVAAEFLTGAVHVSANQFNENAKTFASYHQIPEVDHHLLESLRLPMSNKLDNIFVFFNSDLYRERNQKRFALTQEAIDRQDIQTIAINLISDTKLAQVFELITLMAYTNFYLAMIHGIDPSKIPTVDWFKQELSK
jgi:glucose/mannose-6-phosphate isomerase